MVVGPKKLNTITRRVSNDKTLISLLRISNHWARTYVSLFHPYPHSHWSLFCAFSFISFFPFFLFGSFSSMHSRASRFLLLSKTQSRTFTLRKTDLDHLFMILYFPQCYNSTRRLLFPWIYNSPKRSYFIIAVLSAFKISD